MPITLAPEPSTETWSLQTIVPHDSTAELAQDTSSPAGHASVVQKPSSQSPSPSIPLSPEPEDVDANVTRVQVAEATTVEEADDSIVPPDNAAEDMRPTRRYQAVLLLAGFMMIFQVIGINQTYGIFQVGQTCVRTDGRTKAESVELDRSFIRPRRVISKMLLGRRLLLSVSTSFSAR